MKSKFKAWVIAHKYDYFGLFRLGEWFREYDVCYNEYGYPTESPPPTPAGWYTFTVLDGRSEETYAYFSDPDRYAEYLADCGMSSMMTGCCDIGDKNE